MDRRVRAEIEDVKIAMNRMLENWWDAYFRDLWVRTPNEQRACLAAIINSEGDNVATIEQKSILYTERFRQTLQVLIRRDLVVSENGVYHISTPIFREWGVRELLT